jgi:hypothetical protein
MICVLIVLLFGGNLFVRGFIGDIIVILLIYFFMKVFYDFKALNLTVCVLALAFLTEFLQDLKLITFLGLQHNAAARIILGAVFDPFDLIAYVIGAVLVYIIDMHVVRRAI